MTAEETKLMQDMVEALAIADVAMEKAAAEIETVRKSASARPDYRAEMEAKVVGILDLLSRTSIDDFRFSDANSPLRKSAQEQLLDPMRAIDFLTFAVGRLAEETRDGGDGNPPRSMGNSVEKRAAVQPTIDPNHPDLAYFAGL